MSVTMDIKTAQEAISELGLSEIASAVFLDLTSSGISTALDISHRTSIPRTTVYRALEELQLHKLVRFDGRKKTHYRAAQYRDLKKLVDEQEHRVLKLNESLPELFGFLFNMASTSSSKTEINHYEGVKGIKQATLNTLEARGTFRAFESSHMNEFLDLEFAEYIRRENVKNQCVSNQISNVKKSPNFTKVKDYVNKYWFIRYMDPKLLPVEVDIWIYNDTLTIYEYIDEPFAVEIKNEKLARMQRSWFDFTWKQAKKMRFVGTGGAAVLD